MDQPNIQRPQPGSNLPGMPMNNMPPQGLIQGRPLEMGGPMGGIRPGMANRPMMPGGQVVNMGMPIWEHDEKRREFAKGVYVSGFEKTLTVTMLQKYFSEVKTVNGIKLPMTKFNENKGFAFIYFNSEDDAKEVIEKLDRTVILRNKIRVTRTVIPDNLLSLIHI